MNTHNTVSSTTIISTTTTWSYLLKINSYTLTTKLLGPYVPAMTGPYFPAGGHSWRISLYPNRGDPALVHLELRFRCGHLKPPVNAVVRFTLLPRDGGEPPLTLSRTFEPRCENPMVDIKKDDLNKYVGEDDSLSICCDVRAIQTNYLRKEVLVRVDASSGSPSRPSRIKTAWLGFTRRLLRERTGHEVARPLPVAAEPRAGSEKLVCTICLEVLVDGETCSEVPACHHLYHKNCIDVWMKSNATCPLCRRHVVAGSERVVTVTRDMVSLIN